MPSSTVKLYCNIKNSEPLEFYMCLLWFFNLFGCLIFWDSGRWSCARTPIGPWSMVKKCDDQRMETDVHLKMVNTECFFFFFLNWVPFDFETSNFQLVISADTGSQHWHSARHSISYELLLYAKHQVEHGDGLVHESFNTSKILTILAIQGNCHLVNESIIYHHVLIVWFFWPQV